MPDAASPPAPHEAGRFVCDAGELPERGRAVLFEVLHFGERLRAFALRIDGRPVAYLNRCVHVPTELDWQPGEFLDDTREWIVCSMHGAVYQPATGRCAGGPCGRGRLVALEVEEREGKVYWYPSRDTCPLPAPAGVSPDGAMPSTPAESRPA